MSCEKMKPLHHLYMLQPNMPGPAKVHSYNFQDIYRLPYAAMASQLQVRYFWQKRNLYENHLQSDKHVH